MLRNEIDTRDWFFGLLMRRAYTRSEAEDRLKARGANEDEAEALIAEALEMRLLDDSTYARLFAEGHESWGKNRIAFELERRGLEDDDIQSALDDIDEEDRLRPLIASWQKSGLEMRKIIARLYRRGFSGRAIRSACQFLDD